MASWKRYFVADGRLRSGWRVVGYLVSYMAALLGVQVLIIFVYVAWRAIARGGAPPPISIAKLPQWLLLLLSAGELVVLVPITYLWCRYVDRRAFGSLGFGRGRRWLWDLSMGVALGSVQIALVFGVEWAGGWIAVRSMTDLTLVKLVSGGAMAVVLFVLVAFNEELVFRGYLQTNLREGVGAWAAVALNGALFGIAHAFNPHFGLLPFLNIVLAGLVLGYARQVTDGLWLPMGYHFSWNLVQGPLLGLPVSGMQHGGLLHVVDRGVAVWLTGGNFGLEGGVLCTVVLLTGFPILWLWGRRRRDHQLV